MRAPKKLTREEQEARGDLRTTWLPPDQEWLYDQYTVQGKSANQISDEVRAGYSGEIVKRWLVLLGVPIRGSRHKSPTRDWLEYHYTVLGKSAGAIELELGVDDGTVRKWLYDVEILIRSPGLQKGERHYRWIGGGRRHARHVKAITGVPKVCEQCGSSRFVVVHHLDSDKNNNELGNLQYLCSSCHKYEHPS